ncbi:hypothetical protein DICA4_D21330 [Diutina catenulata]
MDDELLRLGQISSQAYNRWCGTSPSPPSTPVPMPASNRRRSARGLGSAKPPQLALIEEYPKQTWK